MSAPELATNALVTLPEARRFVWRDDDDASRDGILVDGINLVSEAILAYLGREVVATDAVARTFSVDASGFVDLRPWELRAADSIVLHPDRDAGDQVTLGADDYRLFPAGGSAEGTFLWMQLDEPHLTQLHAGFGWQVEVTGDWGIETTPSSLKLAALHWLKNIVENPGAYASYSMNGYSVAPELEAQSGPSFGMPAAVRYRLEPFRRVTLLV